MVIREELREAAASLGPPIYGLRGRRLRTNTFGGDRHSLGLFFGSHEHAIGVETSTEPVDDDRMLLELVLMLDPEFPLVIDEQRFELSFGGEAVSFEGFAIDENWWCGRAAIGDRFLYLRAIDSPRTGISLREVRFKSE